MYKIILFVFLVVSCGSNKNSTQQPVAVRVLTAEEKQRLLTPTIYYIPKYTEFDHYNCYDSDKIDLVTIDGDLITRSCRKIYKSCEMQGTCQIEVNGEHFLINVDARNGDGVRTFRRVVTAHCLYGLGASKDRVRGYKHMCIDPYYSVAADLSIYNLGDVIFIPLLKGLALPNGEKHNGYVIVRDSGGAIRGVGRFDFFTGYLGLTRNNPFFKLGLGGDSIFPEYEVLRGAEADRIRESRYFPYLKPSVLKTARRSSLVIF
jgi:3D (Asp-Asp-Asp) domain-containing protein